MSGRATARTRFALGLVPVIMLLACRCALALDPSLDVSQYAHTAWRVREGFGKGSISSIVQTPDGYLWLGTYFGLLRFDGVRNVAWQPPAGQRLPSDDIYSLLAARDGTLWIGTIKGLVSWKGSKLTQYPELSGRAIFALLEDREGTVWVGAMAFPPPGRLCGIHSGSVHCDGQNGSLGMGVYGLYEDRKGTLWAQTRTGLWRWKPGPAQSYPLSGEPGGWGAPVEDSEGTILFAMHDGIAQLVNGKIEAYKLPGNVKNFQPRKLLRDRDGGLWIGTLNSGLLHLHDGRVDVFSSSDGLSSDYVNDIIEDREGSVWVATDGGLDRFRGFAITTLTNKQGLSTTAVFSIQADGNGSVWLSTRGGLDRWDNGKIVAYQSQGGAPVASSGAFLFQNRAGRLWAFTRREAGFMQKERFVPVSAVRGGAVHSVAEDANGDLWISHQDAGLVRIRDGKEVQEIPWAGLGHKNHAATIAADPSKGGLWLGFFDGGVDYFADGTIRKSYTVADGLGEGQVNSLRFDRNGILWAATQGGLGRLKNGHFATLNGKNGLPCDAVHWMIEDDDQSVWLYMPCGLVRVTNAEMHAWEAAADRNQDSKQKVRFTMFDSSDGVMTIPIANLDSQVAKSPDGKVWFLASDGVSVIDPHHLPVNKIPPPVHIEQVVADHKSYPVASDEKGNVRLPPLIRDLQVDYTALSLVAPEKVLFRYKLEGWDRDWQDAGTRRQAFYNNLPPRNYTFRVMACNNSGVWNEAGTSIDFSVLPAFYQTNRFRALCVFGVLALVWCTYQLRIQQLQRQFNIGLEARVNERTRIARELHDTLLQTLHGLMFQFQAVRNLMPRRPDEAMKSLDDAIDETEKALSESRDAIHGLRSEPIAKGNLSELLIATSQEFLRSETANKQPPVFELIEEGERRTLSPIIKNDVCRIAREILRNAYRHAGAHRIETEVRYGDHTLRIRVRDDGKGIDPSVLKEGGIAGHWGLRGIRERAERIGGQLEFWSERGAGTEVQLSVPAPVAYDISPESVGSKLLRKLGKHAQQS